MSADSKYAGDPSLSKLLRVYGPERTETLVQETLHELGIPGIQSADDRLRFGRALIKRGGLLEVIGRAIRIQAILQGAREE
jgi:hypothetical protein